jgi:hypothetical protein
MAETFVPHSQASTRFNQTADLQRKVTIKGREATGDGVYLRILVHANEHMGTPCCLRSPERHKTRGRQPRNRDFARQSPTWEQTPRLPGRHNQAFPAPAEATVTCKDHKAVIDLFRRDAW